MQSFFKSELALWSLILGIGCHAIGCRPAVPGATKTVGHLALKEGGSVSIKQWPNGTDFYSVEFEHIETSGVAHYCLVDADAPKWWRCHISQLGQQIVIMHQRQVVGIYNLETFVLTRANGIEVPAQSSSFHSRPISEKNGPIPFVFRRDFSRSSKS